MPNNPTITEAHLKVNLIPATRADFLSGDKVLYGEIFFLRRKSDDQFEGPYTLRPEHTIIPKNHSTSDFGDWLTAGMVYRQQPGEPIKITTE